MTAALFPPGAKPERRHCTMHDTHGNRRIEFAGACNCRDLGGLPVAGGGQTRRGILYRSDSLATLTDQDLIAFEQLALKTVYDLRTQDERTRAPDRLPAVPPNHVVAGFLPRGNLDMFGAINDGRMTAEVARRTMCEQYERIALEHLTEFRRVVEGLLVAGATPALLHCTSGKDRTGIVTALILLAVGVPRLNVIEDYLVSDRQRRRIDLFGARADPEVVEQVMSAKAEYLESALAAVTRDFGSIDGYLALGLGLTRAPRERLKALLVV